MTSDTMAFLAGKTHLYEQVHRDASDRGVSLLAVIGVEPDLGPEEPTCAHMKQPQLEPDAQSRLFRPASVAVQMPSVLKGGMIYAIVTGPCGYACQASCA